MPLSTGISLIKIEEKTVIITGLIAKLFFYNVSLNFCLRVSHARTTLQTILFEVLQGEKLSAPAFQFS